MKVQCPPPQSDQTITATEILYVRNVLKPTEVENSSSANSMILTLADKIYSLQTPAQVKDLANPERSTPLSLLSSINGWPIFFAGERAKGPLQLTENEVNKSHYNSAFLIGNKKIPVINTAQEVFDVIQAAGGQTRPVLPPVKSETWGASPDEGEWDETITLFSSPDDAA